MMKIIVDTKNFITALCLEYIDEDMFDNSMFGDIRDTDDEGVVYNSFNPLIKELREIQMNYENALILPDVIWLFEQFEPVRGNSNGNSIYITDIEAICDRIRLRHTLSSEKNLYEAWHMLIYDLGCFIEELFRQGSNRSDAYAFLLKDVLLFLSNTTFCLTEEEFLKLIK